MKESRSKTWRWSMMEKPRSRKIRRLSVNIKSHSILYRLSFLVGLDSPLKWQTPICQNAQVSYHFQLQFMKCYDLYKSMYNIIFKSYRLLAVTPLKRQHFKGGGWLKKTLRVVTQYLYSSILILTSVSPRNSQ